MPRTDIFHRQCYCRNTTRCSVVASILIALIYSSTLESEWLRTSDAFLDHNTAIASNWSQYVAPSIHVVKSSNEFLFSLAKCLSVTSLCIGQGLPSNVYWSGRVVNGRREFRHDSTLHVGALPHHVRSTDKTYRKDECDVTSPLHVKATSTNSRSQRNYASKSTDVKQTVSDRSLLNRQSWKLSDRSTTADSAIKFKSTSINKYDTIY